LNYPHFNQFLKDFEFIYHPVIDSSYTLDDVIKKDLEVDILILEGAVSPGYKKDSEPVFNLISKYGKKSKYIVTAGTCATFGGLFKESGYLYTTGLHFKEQSPTFLFHNLKSKTVSVSGCPIHPELLVRVLYSLKEEVVVDLDEFLRPKEFFSYTVHNGCIRNEYFEYKVDNHRFGNKEGCMFYDHGCQAPYVRGSCNKILWNETNSKTRVGEPCHGCTEPTFPKQNLYVTKKHMGIPATLPYGVGKRAYLTLAGVAKAFKIKRLEDKLF
jgi:hydrogenase small subunit